MVGCSATSRRNDLELKTALIQRLIDCNDHESAYEFTLENHERNWVITHQLA